MLVPVSISVTFTIVPDWTTVVLVAISRQLVGFLISLGLWLVYRRWAANGFQITRRLGPVALSCVAATLLDFAAIEAMRRLFDVPPLPDVVIHGVWMLRGAIYVAWSALYFLIRHELETRGTELRVAQAEAASREAELLQLRAQMNPHFLFNALSNIVGQAEHNPSAVIDTTHAVADYLRYSLTHSSHHAPLGDELEAMRNYLRVETTVHGAARIKWRIDATDEARTAVTPTALVQPLIENAIKYGLRTSPQPLQVRVLARVEAGRVHLAVENSGVWIARDPAAPRPDSTGIGLTNLRRRLELLYGDAARLDVTTPPGFIRVEVHLPFRS